jgi:hypothetical protein
MMVGSTHSPVTVEGCAMPARSNSSAMITCSAGPAPRPYGAGYCGETRPWSASSACRRAGSAAWAARTVAATPSRNPAGSPSIRMVRARTACRECAATDRASSGAGPSSALSAMARRQYS